MWATPWDRMGRQPNLTLEQRRKYIKRRVSCHEKSEETKG